MTEYQYRKGDVIRVSREVTVSSVDGKFIYATNGSIFSEDYYSVDLIKRAVEILLIDDVPLGTLFVDPDGNRWVKVLNLGGYQILGVETGRLLTAAEAAEKGLQLDNGDLRGSYRLQ